MSETPGPAASAQQTPDSRQQESNAERRAAAVPSDPGTPADATDEPPPATSDEADVAAPSEPTEADIAAALDAMGLTLSDGEDAAEVVAEAAQAAEETATRQKPPARRAGLGVNIAVQGLPTTYEEVQRTYKETGPAPRPAHLGTTAHGATVMTDSQIDNLLAALGESSTAPQYSWTTPAPTYGYAPYRPPQRRAAASHADDIEDKISTVQDTLADLETNLATVDSMVTETSTAVDSLTEDVHVLKETTADGMSSMRSEMQLLTAQVASLHDSLADIKALLTRMAEKPSE